MDVTASFTEQVRQELASRPLGSASTVWAELAGLARCAGRLTVIGGGSGRRLTIGSTSGAVVRRAYTLLQHRFALRAELAVRAAGGMRRRSSYEVRVPPGAADHVATDLGLLDPAGRPVADLPVAPDGQHVTAFLRGAVLACGSFSAPGRPAHLELVPGSTTTAEGLGALLAAQLDITPRVVDARGRVVVKSGETIGDLLVLVGATGAFLRWDEHRMRRQLRSDANRLANADAANLRRTIEAAASQVRAVEEVVARLGWDALDDDLREVALARLANPGASLQELGALLDPPVGKSAVHRRLRRLTELETEARG